MRHCYIANVDRWPDIDSNTMQIEQVLTSQIDTCSFHIRGLQPQKGDEIIIEDDRLTRLFGGIITTVELVDQSYDFTDHIWQVDANDYSYRLNQRLVVETYSQQTADYIFRDIVNKYCPGFTVNGVQSNAPIVDAIIFDYVQVSDAFKQLADYVGWQWMVDYYKDLQFFDTALLGLQAPMILVQGGYFRNIKHKLDQTDLRNRVYVRGGTMLSDPFTYSIVADGVSRTWILPHKPHDISMIVGNDPSVVPGIENIDDETTKAYMMNFEEKYVKASTQTASVAQGTTISFTYKYDMDVITTVEDTDSQAVIAAIQNDDGVFEWTIQDDSLISLDAAEAAGNADLKEHANPRVTGSFETEYDHKMSLWSDLVNMNWGGINV